jgi:toxin ParE1/3/4
MRIVWADSARLDFDKAIAFTKTEGPKGARRIGDRIVEAVALLEQFPELAQASRHRGLRQLVVARTPYIVVYRIHEDRVEIRAVIHTNRGAASSLRTAS